MARADATPGGSSVAATPIEKGADGSHDDEIKLHTAHAVMCNPPFFESVEQAGHNPTTVLTATKRELSFPGGEVAFVQGLIRDSIVLRHRVCWYTTMLGCKGHVDLVVAKAKEAGAQTIRTNVLKQGKTLRWCVGWSFF